MKAWLHFFSVDGFRILMNKITNKYFAWKQSDSKQEVTKVKEYEENVNEVVHPELFIIPVQHN